MIHILSHQSRHTAGCQYNSDETILLVFINGMMATAQIPPHLKRLHDALHCALHWISVYNPSWTVYKHIDMHPASPPPTLHPFVKLRRIKTRDL